MPPADRWGALLDWTAGRPQRDWSPWPAAAPTPASAAASRPPPVARPPAPSRVPSALPPALRPPSPVGEERKTEPWSKAGSRERSAAPERPPPAPRGTAPARASPRTTPSPGAGSNSPYEPIDAGAWLSSLSFATSLQIGIPARQIQPEPRFSGTIQKAHPDSSDSSDRQQSGRWREKPSGRPTGRLWDGHDAAEGCGRRPDAASTPRDA